MNDVVEVLKKAKERVAKGWLQNRSINEVGQVCASKAISSSAFQLSGVHVDTDHLRTQMTCDRACQLLLAAAQEQTSRSWGSIPIWNDFDGRTQDEVLDTFDHAIKLAEKEASDA